MAGEAAVHDPTCMCEGNACCCRMLRAAVLALAGYLQKRVGTQGHQVLLVLQFLHPRHGRALLSPASPGKVVTLACCLSSCSNERWSASRPSLLSREAQMKKVVRALAANTACALGKANCRGALA